MLCQITQHSKRREKILLLLIHSPRGFKWVNGISDTQGAEFWGPLKRICGLKTPGSPSCHQWPIEPNGPAGPDRRGWFYWSENSVCLCKCSKKHGSWASNGQSKHYCPDQCPCPRQSLWWGLVGLFDLCIFSEIESSVCCQRQNVQSLIIYVNTSFHTSLKISALSCWWDTMSSKMS